MRKLLMFLCLTYVLSTANGQTPLPHQPFIGIDHIPIVVKDLDGTNMFFSKVLHFKIKNGRAHEGIKNSFIKFQDGTYLEFTTPLDASKEIGSYYAEALKKRQGGTAIAVSVQSADRLIHELKSKSLPFDVSTNTIWKTVSPKGIDLFLLSMPIKNGKIQKRIQPIQTLHFLSHQRIYFQPICRPISKDTVSMDSGKSRMALF